METTGDQHEIHPTSPRVSLEQPDLDKTHSASISRPTSSASSPPAPVRNAKGVNSDDPASKSKHWLNSWVWETGAVISSAICLALLVAFLVKIQNTPYADWQYRISPNTVISIIVTFIKAALLVPVSSCLSQLKWNEYRRPTPLYNLQVIDQASRGPWGSAEVLIRGILGLRLDIRTLIGALITILALGIDPFAQQILSFRMHTVRAWNETASIQAAYGYNVSIGDEDAALPSELFSSIMGGITQTKTPLEPDCNSNSCDFPEFVTLGFCYHCGEIASKVERRCFPSDDEPIHSTKEQIKISRTARPNCNYTLSDGVVLTSISSAVETLFNDSLRYRFNEWDVSTAELEGSGTYVDPIIRLLVRQNAWPTYTPENMTALPPLPSIMECSMALCEQKYAPSQYVAIDRASHSPRLLQTQQLNSTGVVVENINNMPVTNQVGFIPANNKAPLAPDRSSYEFNEQTYGSLLRALKMFFNTADGQSGPPPDKDTRLGTSLNPIPIFKDYGIEPVIKSLASSLTNTMRTGTKSKKIPGIAFRDETFIQVRWPWIIFPVVIFLGAAMLLLGTSLASRAQGAVVWKSSVFPLLMTEMDTTPDHDIMGLRNADEVESRAKRIKGTMADNGGRLLFRES